MAAEKRASKTGLMLARMIGQIPLLTYQTLQGGQGTKRRYEQDAGASKERQEQIMKEADKEIWQELEHAVQRQRH